MTDYSHETLMALAGAYALGATTPEERRAIELAIDTSPELAAEVLAYNKVVTDLLLAEAGSVVTTPLRERVLERIGEQPAHRASVSVPRHARRSLLFPIAAAASVLLLLGAGYQYSRMRREITALRGAEEMVAAQLEHRETTLNMMLHAENYLKVVHLKAADTVAGPGIQLFWDSRHQMGIVHAFRLPPAPTGHSYQLWAVVGNEPVSVRVFDSSPDGHALVEGIMLPKQGTPVSKILVTVEPRGGSRSPTSMAVMGSAD